jgi:hypothetical protein
MDRISEHNFIAKETRSLALFSFVNETITFALDISEREKDTFFRL